MKTRINSGFVITTCAIIYGAIHSKPVSGEKYSIYRLANKARGASFLWGGGVFWRYYLGALIPAHVKPCFLEMTHSEEKLLLDKACNSWLLRYASHPSQSKTEWYYVMIDSYDFAKLSSNMRNQIKRGQKNNGVEQVSAEWLAINGYPCYFSAYNRYAAASPVTEEHFRNSILKMVGGPFEYWAVFTRYDNKCAGYCIMIKENNHVNVSTLKYVPERLKDYSSYALLDKLIKNYVVDKNMTINNGYRAISHDTNIQDFLLKFGFRRKYCRLNVVYSPALKILVTLFFPLRNIFKKLPDVKSIHRIKSLLFQEQIRRSCLNI